MKQIIYRIVFCLTLSRLLLSPLLLLLPNPTFLFLYLYCGLSDILDGYLARKYQVTTQSGSSLDSIADVVFFGSALLRIFPLLTLPSPVWYWIGGITLWRLSALLLFRHKEQFLHSFGNRVMGIALFLFPLFPSLPAVILLCLFATGVMIRESLTLWKLYR